MKNLKKNQGITLIALVITIIVMLILVAVTITMAVNGGLFGYARNASVETKQRRDEELEIANIESGKSADELVNYFTNRINFTICYLKTGGNITITYTAEKGMKWREWFQTSYYHSNGLDFDFYMSDINAAPQNPTKDLKKVKLTYLTSGDEIPAETTASIDQDIIENKTYFLKIIN